MPIYTVQGPDGRIYEIEGPAGATQEQLESAVSMGGSQAPAKTAPEGSKAFARAGAPAALVGSPRLDALRAGIAQAGIKGALGIKQFFGGLSDEDKAVLREVEAEDLADPKGGWRLGGEIAGNVAATAVPGAKLAKTLGATRAVKATGALAAPLTAAGTSAGTEFAVAPGEGDDLLDQAASKVKKALQAGAFGGMLQAGGSVLRKALTKPFAPTAEAQKLLDQGIVPTLQQGSESSTGRFVGGLTSGALDSSRRQNQEVLDAFLKRVAPGLDTKNMSPSEIVSHVDTVLQQERDGLFAGKMFKLTPAARSEIWKAARGGRGTQPEAADMGLRAMGGTGAAMTARTPIQMRAEKMQETRDLLQDAIGDFKGDNVMETQARKNLIAAKNKFDELVRDPALTPDERVQLGDLNARYSDALRLFEAAKSPAAQKQIRVADLMRGYQKMAPGNKMSFAKAEGPMLSEILEPSSRVLGLMPNQDEARSAMVAARRIAAPVGKAAAGGAAGLLVPGAAAPLAGLYGLSLAGQTRPGARALFGDFAAQKKLEELMRESFPYTAGLGSAAQDKEF